MLCWATSFYPQPILNIRRRTTFGFSIEFALLNILGMASYAIYSLALFSAPVIRRQYADRYPHHPLPTVQLNDVAYCLHGAVMSAIIYSQFYPRLWGFAPIDKSKCSRWTLTLFWGCLGAILLATFVALCGMASESWLLLDVVSNQPQNGFYLAIRPLPRILMIPSPHRRYSFSGMSRLCSRSRNMPHRHGSTSNASQRMDSACFSSHSILREGSSL